MWMGVSVVTAMKIHRLVKSSRTNVLRATDGVTYIANPVPEHLADLKTKAINTAVMQTSVVPSPDGKQILKIFTFPTHQDRVISGHLNKGASWESHVIKRIFNAWQSEGSGKGNFLDLGANIGTYTLAMASVMKNKHKVIAIEAMPPIADHVRAGIVANEADNVVLFPYAIGEPASANDLQMAYHPTNKGGSAVVGNKPWLRSAQKFSVGRTTLDSLMKMEPAMNNVFYAKFDIEGNEGRALAGAQELFTKHPPCVVLMEMNEGYFKNAGTSIAEIESELASFGYDIAGHVNIMALLATSMNKEYRLKNFTKCVDRLQ